MTFPTSTVKTSLCIYFSLIALAGLHKNLKQTNMGRGNNPSLFHALQAIAFARKTYGHVGLVLH